MILTATILFIIGAVLGSFACCQAWRIKNRDKSPRSHCQSCSYHLRWFDNIPILSWLALKGKCRKCGHRIGLTELLAELGLGIAFVVTYLFYPAISNIPCDLQLLFHGFNWLPLAEFTTFLVFLVPLALLFIYDLRWGKLPTSVLTFSIICAIIWVILRQWSVILMSGFSPNFITNLLAALLILPGIYYILYKFSNERWVGGGDWLLCIPFALILGNFLLAFLCLFLANLLGTLTIIPTLIRRKTKPHTKIHFGPFLILAFLITFLIQPLLTQLL